MNDAAADFVMQTPSAVTVRNVAQFAHDLSEICETHRRVTLDLADLTEADLSLIQLICAARLHLEREGGRLRLAGPAGHPLAELLVRAGFSNAPDEIEFWFHGVLPQ